MSLGSASIASDPLPYLRGLSGLVPEQRLAAIASTPRPSPKPKVYFEEWDDPLISGIGWVSELIEIAGGQDVLPNLRFQQAAKDRIVSADLVRDAAPDVILASWCGKKVVPDKIRNRAGWSEIPAVRKLFRMTNTGTSSYVGMTTGRSTPGLT